MDTNLLELSRTIDYQFQQNELLELALTHRSHNGSHNNERLEFLGDSILNFVIGEALFQKFPKAREGQLSRLRATLVKGATLTKVAKQLELGPSLRLGPGEMKSGGHRRDSILADAVEAIIGAVYLDAGMVQAQKLILNWFQQRLDGITLDDTTKDNKTRLQELLQARKLGLPDYDIVDVSGKSHAQKFVVSCNVPELLLSATAEGQSRRQAEQIAAGKVLAELEGDESGG
ncbi:MAG: ribonuclease III [Pseudomonadales bacterium]|nr:ribonuclease III [Pseudomonadales bacterium]RLU02221.1 MAG: ribonuclease III [Ketobacter sp.]